MFHPVICEEDDDDDDKGDDVGVEVEVIFSTEVKSQVPPYVGDSVMQVHWYMRPVYDDEEDDGDMDERMNESNEPDPSSTLDSLTKKMRSLPPATAATTLPFGTIISTVDDDDENTFPGILPPPSKLTDTTTVRAYNPPPCKAPDLNLK